MIVKFDEFINEDKHSKNFDIWSKIETDKSTTKQKKSKKVSDSTIVETELTTIKDFLDLIRDMGKEKSESNAENIVKTIIKKLSIKQINTMSQFGPLEDTKIQELLQKHVEKNKDKL